MIGIVTDARTYATRGASGVAFHSRDALTSMGVHGVHVAYLRARTIYCGGHFTVAKRVTKGKGHTVNYNVCDNHVLDHRIGPDVGNAFATSQVRPVSRPIKCTMVLFGQYREQCGPRGVLLATCGVPRKDSLFGVAYDLRRLYRRYTLVLYYNSEGEGRRGRDRTGTPARLQCHYSPNRGRRSNRHFFHLSQCKGAYRRR